MRRRDITESQFRELVATPRNTKRATRNKWRDMMREADGGTQIKLECADDTEASKAQSALWRIRSEFPTVHIARRGTVIAIGRKSLLNEGEV